MSYDLSILAFCRTHMFTNCACCWRQYFRIMTWPNTVSVVLSRYGVSYEINHTLQNDKLSWRIAGNYYFWRKHRLISRVSNDNSILRKVCQTSKIYYAETVMQSTSFAQLELYVAYYVILIYTVVLFAPFDSIRSFGRTRFIVRAMESNCRKPSF